MYNVARDRPGHDRRYAINSTKLQTELAWRPTHNDFAEGLKATIEWYRANEAWAPREGRERGQVQGPGPVGFERAPLLVRS